MIETSKKHLKASASAIRKKTYRPKKKTYESQLLDLEEIADEIVRKIKVIDKKRIIKSILKRRIKEACEFYLRYKDKPSFLISYNNFPQYREEVVGKFFMSFNSNTGEMYYDTKNYNEWLFKLAFKDVVG